MTTIDLPVGSGHEDQIASLCQAHLHREEHLLDGTVQSLRQLHAALLHGQWGALPELLACQEQMVADGRELTEARERLREMLAPVLDMPLEAITLQVVARSLPLALGEPLLRGRDHLVGKVREAETLRHQNATLLRFAADYYHKFLEGLARREAPDRYGPGGRRNCPASGSLIQGRG